MRPTSTAGWAACSRWAPASTPNSLAARTSTSTAPSSACGAAEIARRFDEIVDFAGVERFLDTPVKRYSSGMYVRLAFAVAAHLDTDILLVDEVLAVGDLEFQRRCLGKMESLADSGRTVVFVSHSMETVARLCRTALLLVNGQVQELGPTRQTIERYVSDPAVAGSSRFWDERLAPGDGSLRLLSVRVTDEEGRSAPQLDIRRPVRILVGYEHLADDAAKPLVSLMIKNAEGTLLFSSNSYHAIKDEEPGVGRMSAVCEIPGNYLAEGRHLVGVMINSHSIVHLHEQDVISFDVVDPCLGDSVRGDYLGEWGGYVRPMLAWAVSRVTSDAGHQHDLDLPADQVRVDSVGPTEGRNR